MITKKDIKGYLLLNPLKWQFLDYSEIQKEDVCVCIETTKNPHIKDLNLTIDKIITSNNKIIYRLSLADATTESKRCYDESIAEADTWETGLSRVGQIVKEYANEVEKERVLKEGKTLIFKDLLESNSLGYLALLRNIKNILTNDTQGELTDLLCKRIENYEGIRKAKIMPHQILDAFLNTNSDKVMSALNNAINKSMDNFREVITGKTAVLLDVSGSMYDCKNEASAIAAILNIGLKELDLFTFDDECQKADTTYDKDFMSTYKEYLSYFDGGGTNIPNALYYTLRQEKNYDRIIIISDNESTRYGCIEEYKKIIKANPNIRIYSIDLVPYGESSLPLNSRINLYFGKTFKLFDDMILSEFNPDFYIEEVNKIEI